MDNSELSLDRFFVMDSVKQLGINNRNFKLPVSNSLTFEYLIEHIQNAAGSRDKIISDFARSVLDEYETAPELHGRITDLKVIKKHENIINDMMMFVFPHGFLENQTYAAFLPFSNDIVFATKKFREINFTWDEADGEFNVDIDSLNVGKTISIFSGILSKFYNINLNVEFPIIYKILDPVTGLDKYFKMNFAAEFVDIIAKRKIKKLSQEEIENIRSNIFNLEFVKSILEPENFEYTGLLIVNAINISDTEILSSIRKDLIERDIINSYSGFLKIQHKIKSLLKCSNLLLGITVYPGSRERLCRYGHKLGNSFLINENCLMRFGSVNDSIYDVAIETGKVVIIDDLTRYPKRGPVEDAIISQGINNILVAPLIKDNKIVGLFEIGSPETGKINMVNSLKIRDILPLFALAVDRSNEELKNKVRTIIKEKCTAIHPSLEWNFEKAAIDFLNKSTDGNETEMEEIVFKDVYPLYGLSDIRNSSVIRNQAIRDDLIENLELAGKVILSAKDVKDLKVFDELHFRIEKKINSLKFGLDSGDEAEILKFINRKITPLFEHIQNYGKDVMNAINDYNSFLNENLLFLYKRRKKYEESSMKITGFIAGILDDEQKHIQKIYPHYFERFKTDGVDHNIYIGESLVEDKKFNKIYLRNIRMWQLMMMCSIVRKLSDLKKDLPIPLDTAHLILVQDNPLSIRFRYDEKKFDVDGAYNIRYEIMKKRIDKVEIKGKEERLTQPEKIAIVYSQTSEANEYTEYIEFLQSKGYLKNEIEELELAELQGIKGLKALRVSVDMKNKIRNSVQDNENLKKAMKKLSYN